MLLRICLIVAILAGIGVIAVSQWKVREHIEGIIQQREENARVRDDWHNKFNTSQRTLGTTSNTLVQTASRLDNTRKELDTTKANLESALSAKDQLGKDLAAAKQKQQDAELNLGKWTALNMTPEQALKNREDLEKAKLAIGAMTDENLALLRNVQKLTNFIASILGPKEEEYHPPMPGLKGKVMAVDPKWNFVVLNVGEKQGAQMNGLLLVSHLGKLVGKVKLSEVKEDRSVANVLPGWEVTNIQEGDEVLF